MGSEGMGRKNKGKGKAWQGKRVENKGKKGRGWGGMGKQSKERQGRTEGS